jgi:hypothetical protein
VRFLDRQVDIVRAGEDAAEEGGDMRPPNCGHQEAQLASGHIPNARNMQSVADRGGTSGEPCRPLTSAVSALSDCHRILVLLTPG